MYLVSWILGVVIVFIILYYRARISFICTNYEDKINLMQSQYESQKEMMENIYSSDKIKSIAESMGEKLLNSYDREKNNLTKQVHTNNEIFERQIVDKLRDAFAQVKVDLGKQSSMIAILNQDVEQANEIRKMLFHPQKSGRLSELSLENILASSGLVRDIDYSLQYSIKTLTGSVYRPDAIVFLPNKGQVIIDAKSSTFFMDGKKSAKLIKDQIKDLKKKFYSEKVYDNNSEIKNIITLLYIPSDSLLEGLYESDASMMKSANDSNIFIVGPMSLLHMISLARISIYNNKKVENFDRILFEVDLLVSNILDSKKSIFKISNSIKNLNKDYDDLDRSFTNNILVRAEKIKNHHFITDNEK